METPLTTQELYEQARERVRNTPELAPHEDFIFADWPEGDDHLRWVIDAPVEEIDSWVDACIPYGEDD